MISLIPTKATPFKLVVDNGEQDVALYFKSAKDAQAWYLKQTYLAAAERERRADRPAEEVKI